VIASSYHNLGTVCWRTGDIPQAIYFLDKSLSKHCRQQQQQQQQHSLVSSSTPMETSLMVASVYHQLGICQSLLHNVDSALASFHQALTIRSNVYHGETNLIVARTYDAIGHMYHHIGYQYDDALVYHRKALDICRRLNDTSFTASILHNIVLVYQSKCYAVSGVEKKQSNHITATTTELYSTKARNDITKTSTAERQQSLLSLLSPNKIC
jgi:tetratricopeptide (TPR) repeat protein